MSRTAVGAWWIAVALVSAACGGSSGSSEVANPASVYCEEQGGRVEIVADDDGETGVCVLPDGTRIDEWELFRREVGSG